MLLYIASILGSVLGFVGFVQSLRWAQLRGADTYVVASINYCSAAVVFVIWFFLSSIPVDAPVVVSGLTCGCVYTGCFFLMMYCMHLVGVGRTSMTMGLAPALPIIISIFIWNEIPTIPATIGIVIAAVSIPLILISKSEDRKHLGFIGIIALAGLFTTEGLANTIFKWFEQLKEPQLRPLFLAATFLTAGTLTLMIVLHRKLVIRKIDLFHGAFTAIFCVVANIMFLYCLTLAAAGVILTTITVSSLVLTTITSMILWGERYSLRAVIGIILGVIAVLLINL